MIVVIAYGICFALIMGLGDIRLPLWFMLVLGSMSYTTAIYFYNSVVSEMNRRKYNKMLAKKGTNWSNLTDTSDVEADIKKYAAGLRESAIMATRDNDKQMLTEFEEMFREFGEKLKSANDKYCQKS